MLWREVSCGRKMGKLRRFGSLSERSIMHRHASQQTSSLGRRLRVRSGASLIGYFWMLGYTSVVLGALFSTVFFPEMLSMLRSQRSTMQPYMLSQVFLGAPNPVSEINQTRAMFICVVGSRFLVPTSAAQCSAFLQEHEKFKSLEISHPQLSSEEIVNAVVCCVTALY